MQLLPNNDATRQIGIHKNQYKEVASIKIIAFFDVFNQLLTQFSLFDQRNPDLNCCIEGQMQQLPKDVISLYDRGFGSQLLMFLHGQYGTNYVIRLKTDFSNRVKAFIASGQTEACVREPMSKRFFQAIRGDGHPEVEDGYGQLPPGEGTVGNRGD